MYRLKTTHMKNINIPKPCSENWNEMTPSEKGAFCQKCALDVYDFTNKSGNEIRDILTLNIGSRVCGRIEPKQLAELNHDFSAWQINNQRSYQRAWIFTLFVVFGMTLFSCEEDEVPVVKKFQSTAQVILSNDAEPDSLIVDVPKTETTGTDKSQDIRMGHPDFIEDPEIELLGEFVSYPEENKPVEDSLVRVTATFPEQVLKGAMISTDHYENYLIDKAKPTEVLKSTALSAFVYPNPAVNETTLKVNLPEKAKGEIELFALSGQKIRTIHSGRLQKGETEFALDITDLKTGNYLIVVLVGGKKETVQFSKQ